jgi:hypothetical protein
MTFVDLGGKRWVDGWMNCIGVCWMSRKEAGFRSILLIYSTLHFFHPNADYDKKKSYVCLLWFSCRYMYVCTLSKKSPPSIVRTNTMREKKKEKEKENERDNAQTVSLLPTGWNILFIFHF